MIKTAKATLLDMLHRIEWSVLPQTFQDAISITRTMGIQYLWIGCLCIVQDDAQDWERESENMVDYYSAAYLNLAATHASDPSYGLLTERFRYDNRDDQERSSIKPIELRIHFINGVTTSLYARQAFANGHDEIISTSLYPDHQFSPLLERAWVFQ